MGLAANHINILYGVVLAVGDGDGFVSVVGAEVGAELGILMGRVLCM